MYQIHSWHGHLRRQANWTSQLFIAWAFATVSEKDEQLFKALAMMAERRLDQFNTQNLANTAWVFVAVGEKDERLFKALANMAERRLDEFNAQNLANTA